MTTQPTFAITGVAGYVAPKHLEAIQTIGGKLAIVVNQLN